MYGSPLNSPRRANVPKPIRAYSPQLPPQRSSPMIFSPTTKSGNSNQAFSSGISDLFTHLQEQLKRINPNFTFQFNTENIFAQTAACITQTVDILIAERNKTLALINQVKSRLDIQENYLEGLDMQKDTDKSDSTKETMKKLKKFEQLLKLKEEKINKEKFDVRKERQRLLEEEEEVKKYRKTIEDQENIWQASKKSDQDKMKAEREEIEVKILEAKSLKERFDNKIEQTLTYLKNEKESLAQLESFLNISKQNLSQEQNKLLQDKVKMEKETWRIEQREREINEQTLSLSMQAEKLQNDAAELEQNKADFLFHKKVSEKNQITSVLPEKNKKIKSFLRSDSNKYSTNSEKQSSLEYGNKVKELEERELEIEDAYHELQEQVEEICKSLDDRETAINEKEITVIRLEKEMNAKIEHFMRIENTLNESLAQLDEFKRLIFPDLEAQSEQLVSLLVDLTEKKNSLNTGLYKMNYYIELLQNNSEGEWQKNQGNHLQVLENMIVELETKIKVLNERENDVAKEAERLEIEKEQIIEVKEVMRKAYLEAENQKSKHNEELSKEKEKLKAQFVKVDSIMRLLSTKELELQALNTKLNEKRTLIFLKKGGFDLKFTHFPDLSLLSSPNSDLNRTS
jgi:hypothetical protein